MALFLHIIGILNADVNLKEANIIVNHRQKCYTFHEHAMMTDCTFMYDMKCVICHI